VGVQICLQGMRIRVRVRIDFDGRDFEAGIITGMGMSVVSREGPPAMHRLRVYMSGRVREGEEEDYWGVEVGEEVHT
jgi:hypothetical protein